MLSFEKLAVKILINFECNFNFEIQMENDFLLEEEIKQQWRFDDIKLIDLLCELIEKDPHELQR